MREGYPCLQPTICDAIREQAVHRGSRTALTLLNASGEVDIALDYAELDRRARACAATLQQQFRPGDRLILALPRGIELIEAFFGALYAGIVPVPLEHKRFLGNQAQMQAMLADTTASAIVLSESDSQYGDVRTLSPDAWRNSAASDWTERPTDPQSLAFLQYTSGSISTPRGVMVGHDNLSANGLMIRRAFGLTEDSTVVTWLPLFHDMGLIGTLMQPLWVGAHAVLLSPAAFLQKPLRWLEAISAFRGTISGAPNFAYDLCVRHVTSEEAAALDLSAWNLAFNGAEPVRAATLERFAAQFAASGFDARAFFPCYGLAEATLFVSGSRVVVDEGLGRPLVGAGMPAPELEVWTESGGVATAVQSFAGGVGEILVKGPSVARGYWNRPAETAETFGAYTADGRGPFLRTGDLGYVNAAGQLVVTGRVKELLIVRGVNHYPHDLEATAAAAHESFVAGGAAAFMTADDDERVAVVQEVAKGHAADALPAAAESLRRAIASAHGITPAVVALVRRGTIPKTTSGKTQRRRTAQLLASGELPVLYVSTIDAAATERADAGETASTLERVRALAARILHVAPSTLADDVPLAAYGLDSLSTMELRAALEASESVALSVESLFSGTIATIAAALERGEQTTAETLDLTANELLPLTRGQKALWFLGRFAPDSAAYNIAAALEIPTAVDSDDVRRAFAALIERHALLGARIDAPGGEPVFRAREVAQEVRVVDAAPWDDAAVRNWIAGEAHRAVDLDTELFRAVLLQRSGSAILLVVISHVAGDFLSLGLLATELGELLAAARGRRAPRLEPVLPFAAFARWQESMLSGPRGEALWNYWRERLADTPPPLALHTDRERPRIPSYRGATVSLAIGEPQTRELRRRAGAAGVTVNAYLLAAFQALLHRHADQRELLVGTPASGRTREAFARTFGYLANPVLIRSKVAPDTTFGALLAATSEQIALALEHQDFPFPLLAERLHPERDPGASPLIRAMFQFHRDRGPSGIAAVAAGADGAAVECGPLLCRNVAFEQRATPFDLVLDAADTGSELLLRLRYSTDLFEEARVEWMLRSYATLLAAAAPERRVAELPLLGERDVQTVLKDWNATDGARPRATLASLFDVQAARTPDATALITEEGRTISYRALDRLACGIAERLTGGGIGLEWPIGVYVQRSPLAVAAALAIWKAGGTYLPLDPAYPAARLQTMIDSAGARVVLVAGDAGELTAQRILAIDETLDGDPVVSPAVPDSRAYLIFTSGSTGTPKGVAALHRGAVNRFAWMWTAFPFTRGEVCAQKTSIGFVDSIWEIFGPLLDGVPSLICSAGTARDPQQLVRTLAAHRVTRLVLVPSLLQAILQLPVDETAKLDALWFWISSGEALPPELVDAFRERFPHARLINLYGSSEVAADVTWCDALAERPASIGRPLDNTRAYVLDRRLRPVPPGVPGQLHIAGEGLARGYEGAPRANGTARPIDFSLFYFAADADDADRYRLLLDGARFADDNGLHAVWVPERHLHRFGGVYPSPAVTAAALAAVTKHVQLRAGSVVAPLHHPLRLAEDWSVVDNLSSGRVGLSFASGWHADDFVFAPEAYADRKDRTLQTLDAVRRLWRGETLTFRGGAGNDVDVKLRPRPVSRELPVWVTAAFNPETYVMAAEAGASVLTHLLAQSVGELAEKIALYRRTWRAAGHEGEGRVTLMLHTFLGSDLATVREKVREPFTRYLQSSLDLTKGLARSVSAPGEAPAQLDAEQMETILRNAFERYFRTSGLFGSPRDAAALVEQLRGAGVDEIACLIDFGVDVDSVLESLPWLAELRDAARSARPAAARGSAASWTAERFLPDPFSARPGARMYATGDVAAWTAGGTLDYVGRADRMVKIRGHRVELGEVESALRAYPAVNDAAVIADRRDGEPMLVAYVASDHPASIADDQLLAWLRVRLPEAMLPASIVRLPELPKTGSGKIDRAALPRGVAQRPNLSAPMVPPRNDLESSIAGAWQQFLQLDAVGVNDSFFDLGGHSLMLVRVHARLQETLRREIQLIDLFRFPTIASLADYLSADDGNAAVVQSARARAARQRSRMSAIRSSSGGAA